MNQNQIFVVKFSPACVYLAMNNAVSQGRSWKWMAWREQLRDSWPECVVSVKTQYLSIREKAG